MASSYTNITVDPGRKYDAIRTSAHDTTEEPESRYLPLSCREIRVCIGNFWVKFWGLSETQYYYKNCYSGGLAAKIAETVIPRLCQKIRQWVILSRGDEQLTITEWRGRDPKRKNLLHEYIEETHTYYDSTRDYSEIYAHTWMEIPKEKVSKAKAFRQKCNVFKRWELAPDDVYFSYRYFAYFHGTTDWRRANSDYAIRFVNDHPSFLHVENAEVADSHEMFIAEKLSCSPYTGNKYYTRHVHMEDLKESKNITCGQIVFPIRENYYAAALPELKRYQDFAPEEAGLPGIKLVEPSRDDFVYSDEIGCPRNHIRSSFNILATLPKWPCKKSSGNLGATSSSERLNEKPSGVFD